MELSLAVSSGQLQVDKATGLRRNVVGNLIHYGTEETVICHEAPSELAKHNRGIVLAETDSDVQVFTDPFRSIPLFITRDDTGRVRLLSDLSELMSLPGVRLSVDRTGFWECVLYESPLWTRTVFNEVKQAVAASKISVDKHTGRYEIERYWDFGIQEDVSISSAKEAADGLHDRLSDIFQRVEQNENYVIGLSGGMDSRVMAAYLSKYVPRERIKAFTYGYDPRILEYQSAKVVAEILGLSQPRFHKLGADSYRDALSGLAIASGATVGMQHSHMYDVLLRNHQELAGCSHLSTLYTDALFGYHAVAGHGESHDRGTGYTRVLHSTTMDSDVKDGIQSDIDQIEAGFEPSSGFTRLQEFLYVTERHPKFHVYMMHLLRTLLPVRAPFLDYDLLRYTISLPAAFRHQKRILDGLLDTHFPRLSLQRTPHISSRFQSGGEIGSRWQFLHYKLLARLNSALAAASRGRFMLLDKFATEVQGHNLRRYFAKELQWSLEKCSELGLVSDEQRMAYARIPLRSAGLSSRYQMINLAYLLDRFLKPAVSEHRKGI